MIYTLSIIFILTIIMLIIKRKFTKQESNHTFTYIQHPEWNHEDNIVMSRPALSRGDLSTMHIIRHT